MKTKFCKGCCHYKKVLSFGYGGFYRKDLQYCTEKETFVEENCLCCEKFNKKTVFRDLTPELFDKAYENIEKIMKFLDRRSSKF